MAVVSSIPVFNDGMPGTLLQMLLSAADNAVTQQTVPQNGFVGANKWQGMIVDARASLTPFSVTLGPGSALNLTVQPREYFAQEIPATENMTLNVTWITAPVISPQVEGPIISLTTYKLATIRNTVLFLEGFSYSISGAAGASMPVGAWGRQVDLTLANPTAAAVNTTLLIGTLNGTIAYPIALAPNGMAVHTIWRDPNVTMYVGSLALQGGTGLPAPAIANVNFQL